MIVIKSQREIDLMKKAGRIVAKVFETLEPLCKPGNTTKYLSEMAGKVITEMGGKSEEYGYYGYPGIICTSVNDELVHGIPSNRKLREGDIVSCDIVVSYQGYMADACRTFAVGSLKPNAEKLLKVTRECFFKAVELAKPGNRIGDIGNAIEEYAKANGFSVTHDFTGHGIGREMHEDPSVPNFGIPHTGSPIRKGMAIAIEPMVCEGRKETKTLADGWTAVTVDHKLSAHYENTVVITDDGCEIITLTDKEIEEING
jgi:methionyl aminopeptidase